MRATIILLAFFCIGSQSHIHAEEKLRLASGEWSPYQSEMLKYYGVASRIVTEAFALHGIKLEYGYFPWDRSLEYAETGEWDGTLARFFGLTRRNEGRIFISETRWLTSNMYFFTSRRILLYGMP